MKDIEIIEAIKVSQLYAICNGSKKNDYFRSFYIIANKTNTIQIDKQLYLNNQSMHTERALENVNGKFAFDRKRVRLGRTNNNFR